MIFWIDFEERKNLWIRKQSRLRPSKKKKGRTNFGSNGDLWYHPVCVTIHFGSVSSQLRRTNYSDWDDAAVRFVGNAHC